MIIVRVIFRVWVWVRVRCKVIDKLSIKNMVRVTVRLRFQNSMPG